MTIAASESFSQAYRYTVAVPQTWSVKPVALRHTLSRLCCLHRKICNLLTTQHRQMLEMIKHIIFEKEEEYRYIPAAKRRKSMNKKLSVFVSIVRSYNTNRM